ncbi:MAG: hypothetical protein CMJ58_07120 [Planctomycetaceae bacterium]|nr:hypothetical protein [Planctomycetaceae bacterium]
MSDPLPAASPADSSAGPSQRRVAVLLSLAWAAGHFALGSWYVTLGSFIKANTGDAGTGMFAPGFVGTATSAAPIGAMLAPFLAGLLADRFFSTEKIMVVMHLLAGTMLLAAATATSQTVFLAALLGFFICFWPTISLLAAMSMKHLAQPNRQFPLVRGCGTLGWIASGLAIGLLAPWLLGGSIEATKLPLQVAIVAHFVNAVICIWLPHTPPSAALRKLAPSAEKGAQMGQLLRDRTLLSVLLVAFLALVPSPFYYGFVNPFLNWRGMPNPAARMTLGQAVEVVCMLTLPLVLLRVGLRNAVLCGIVTWGARYALLALAAWTGGQQWALYAAIALHGIAYTFVSVSLQMEVETLVEPKFRATAQGLLAVATSGLGSFAGAQLAAFADKRWLPAELAETTGRQWAQFWLAPTMAAGVALVAAFVLLPAGGRSAHGPASAGGPNGT